jgi:hypothetical protein
MACCRLANRTTSMRFSVNGRRTRSSLRLSTPKPPPAKPSHCLRPIIRHIVSFLITVPLFVAIVRFSLETIQIRRTLSTRNAAHPTSRNTTTASPTVAYTNTNTSNAATPNPNSTPKRQNISADFSVKFTDNTSALLLRMLDTLSKALDQANVTYFVTNGALIGSYRHHGRIPWDDDVDIIIDAADKKTAWDTLSNISADYGVFYYKNRFNQVWKFHPLQYGIDTPSKMFRWPFVDIFFYANNATHVWNSWLKRECWPKKYVFPLRRRPYEGLMLPAPCDTGAVLAVSYNVTQCMTQEYDHFQDSHLRRIVTVPCRKLYDIFSFVRQRQVVSVGQTPPLVTETLMLCDRTLSQITLLDGC